MKHGGGEAGAQGVGGQITRCHHPGPEGDWAAGRGRQGGGGVRVMEAGREIKGPLDDITLGLTRSWAQVKYSKGGQPDEGRQAQISRVTPLFRLMWDGSADER